MNCDDIRSQLVDLWRGALNGESRETVESHLRDCPECERESAQLQALWSRLESLDDAHSAPAPSAALRENFYPALAAAQQEMGASEATEKKAAGNERGLPAWLGSLLAPRGALQPVWSLATLILGVGLGAALMWAWNAQNEITRLSAQVESMSRSASLSLLDHPSASERLRGVSWSSQALADARVVDALLTSFRSDPNVNVRLAALETLARMDSPAVRAGLVETLPSETSPVLQVALIEILNRQNGGSLKAIESFLEREDLDPDVRSQIQYLLQSV